MTVSKSYDWVLVLIVFILVIIGVMMLFSTTSVIGLFQYNDAYYFVKRHMMYLLLGLGCLVGGMIYPYKRYSSVALPGFFICLILLGMTLVPGLGVRVGGAQRWLNLGLFQFQPIELMKFFVAVFLSVALANKQDSIKQFGSGLMPILLVSCLPVLVLLIQPDMGNTLLLVFVLLVLLYLGSAALSHLMTLGMMGLGFIALSIVKHPYQLDRIYSFLDPWKDPLGKNYHIIQSFTAIGSGGLFGHGIGQSKLKFFYLPLHYSDFIFSIVCEEGGAVFALIVIGLFASLFYRGFYIASRADSQFGFFLAISLTLFLVMQAFLNIGVVIGVFPITGIPLTFISYGGSSFVSSLFFVGVLLNISRNSL